MQHTAVFKKEKKGKLPSLAQRSEEVANYGFRIGERQCGERRPASLVGLLPSGDALLQPINRFELPFTVQNSTLSKTIKVHFCNNSL